MGSSTKKTTSNQQTNSNSTLTTTPNAPGFVQGPIENYFGQVGGLISKSWNDPDFLATPANSLQNTAYNNASNLPTGQNELGASNGLAAQAATATPGSYTAPTVGTVNVGGVSVPAAVLAQLVEAQAAQAGPAASLLDNFAAYRNVGLDDLVNNNLSAYDDMAGRNTAAANNSLAKIGAFGGSRAAIAQSQLASDQALGRGNLAAKLNYDAFGQQAALANTDAGRRQETEFYNTSNRQQTNLANAAAGNQTNQFNSGQQNQQSQYAAGLESQRQLEQARIAAAAAQQDAALKARASEFNIGTEQGQLDRMLSAAGLFTNNATAGSNIANQNLASQLAVGNNQYGIDKANAGAEIEGLQGLASLLDPALYQALVGQTATGVENGTASGSGTEKTSGGLLGQLGGLAGGLGGLAKGLGGMGIMLSDPRVKTAIKRVGELPDGLGVYEYDYVWGGPRQRGVMADEVSRIRPWALGPTIAGYATVDYSKLENA